MKVAFTYNLRLTDVRETEKEAEYDSAETVSAIAAVFDATERNPAIGSQYLLARVRDSYGRPIVANISPFQSVFQGETRSWEVEGAELDPEAYYVVQLQKNALSVLAASPGATLQAFVGMVGWRELGAP